MAIIPKGGGGKPEEEKTVTAGTSTKVVTPSEGKTIKKGTVNPTPSQSKTVTPSTSQQTVSPDSGKLLSKVIVKAMEDLAPEVTAQTPMISQILSNLGFTADSASGTNKQKLQTNNANLAKIEDYLPHGTYVWKKLTAHGGDFVNFVVSEQSTAYPDGGTQDGYWYEKVVDGLDLSLFGCTKYAVDKFTFSSNTTYKTTVNHSLGEIPKFTFIIGPEEYPSGTNTSIRVWRLIAQDSYFISYGGYIGRFSFNKFTDVDMYSSELNKYLNRTASTININNDDSQSYFAGVEYTLITMA